MAYKFVNFILYVPRARPGVYPPIEYTYIYKNEINIVLTAVQPELVLIIHCGQLVGCHQSAIAYHGAYLGCPVDGNAFQAVEERPVADDLLAANLMQHKWHIEGRYAANLGVHGEQKGQQLVEAGAEAGAHRLVPIFVVAKDGRIEALEQTHPTAIDIAVYGAKVNLVVEAIDGEYLVGLAAKKVAYVIHRLGRKAQTSGECILGIENGQQGFIDLEQPAAYIVQRFFMPILLI